MSLRVLLVFLGVLSFVITAPASPSHAAQRCFTETNECMYGRIADYWNQNGGLSIFGFPIGPEEATTLDGKTYFTQRFERNTLELHPENKQPYDVLLGRLGADRLIQQRRDWFTFPKDVGVGECKLFSETGFSICGAILERWRSEGIQFDKNRTVTEAESLALFGLPLLGIMTEKLSDGNEYQVQWFERARFELHPENPAPYNVQFGLLGVEKTRANEGSFVRLSVPSKRFLPFPKYAISSNNISNLGFYMNNWAQNWYVNPRFYDEIPSREGMSKFRQEFNKDSVQIMITTTNASTRSGSSWNVYIGLAEFETIDSASKYYDLHSANELFIDPKNTEQYRYLPMSRCSVKWAPGIFKMLPGITTIMKCKSKVVNVTLTGIGVNTEIASLMDHLVTYYVDNF